MTCPTCHQPLLTCEFRDIELDFCAQEHGCWFDEGELGAMLQSQKPVLRLDKPGDTGIRHCPRCQAAMTLHRPFEGLDLDCCPHGHGIWFDQTELATLIAKLQGNRLSGELDHLNRLFDTLATKLGGTP